MIFLYVSDISKYDKLKISIELSYISKAKDNEQIIQVILIVGSESKVLVNLCLKERINVEFRRDKIRKRILVFKSP